MTGAFFRSSGSTKRAPATIARAQGFQKSNPLGQESGVPGTGEQQAVAVAGVPGVADVDATVVDREFGAAAVGERLAAAAPIVFEQIGAGPRQVHEQSCGSDTDGG